jgi:hypothetical protein
MVQVLWCGRSESSSARVAYNCIDGAASRVLFAARNFCLLIAINRIKRAGAPSIKLVDHEPVRIRMNV